MNDDYNKPGMATFLAVLTFNLVFFAYLSFFHEGVNDSKINIMNKPASNDTKVELPKWFQKR